MESTPFLVVNGTTVSLHEIDESGDMPRIRFKLDHTWRSPLDFIVPNCTALEFMLRLHNTKAGFWSREVNKPASNSEVKRWLENSGVRFNGRALKPRDMLDFPLFSVIMFPKANRITIL